MLSPKQIEEIIQDLESETDTPPANRCRDEICLYYDELYDCHLFFLLDIALRNHCNLKIEPYAEFSVLVMFY